MLTYINIKNFAIIKEIELDLQSGMTVLTGETGAGKSIIIDTLELALGARSDPSLIRHGAERCEITAIFDITKNQEIKQWLINQELDSEENECIIRRIIGIDGRSKGSINGYPCTQQTMRTLSSFLIEIYGQHEHQALLTPEKQRELLDCFAGNQDLSIKVKRFYHAWLTLKNQLSELKILNDDHAVKLDYINHQLRELEELNITSELIVNLHQEQKQLNQIEQWATNLNQALNLIAENDNRSVISGLYSAKTCLEKFQQLNPQINSTIELFNSAIIQTQEATNELRSHLKAIELNQARGQEIEQQLNLIHDLARKHRSKPEDLQQVYLNFKEQRERLENATDQLQKMETEVNNLAKAYLESALELSKQRQQAALTLNDLVTEKMQLLGMEGGKFAVQFSSLPQGNFSATGLEKIEFQVSANPGQPLMPLSKVASGGELSRFSLAIQVITAEKTIIPTLIFDEVDVGIGGKTAEIVGQLLRKLSASAQVICITHLPQVAAQGHQHLSVTKNTKTKGTEVTIKTLNKQERVDEIARMLGGVLITKQTIAHAREMINSVRASKSECCV